MKIPDDDRGLEANFTLRPNQVISPDKCNNQIDMIYMAFRPNYTLEDEDHVDKSKTLIYVDLIDPVLGISLLDIYTFLIKTWVDICPIGGTCNPGGDGSTTVYGIFELRSQVAKIFAKSNIAQIQNIQVLAEFTFWKSVSFWTVISFSAWFLVSFYWLYVKHPTYWMLDSKKTHHL